MRCFFSSVAVGAAMTAILALVSSPSAFAQTLAFPDFAASTYATGVSQPVAMQFAPDGRLFITEKTGAVRVVQSGGGVANATPFLNLTVNSSGERGLLGIAFDPNFATNNFVYAYYTTDSGGTHNRVSRFTANGNVVQAGSELVLMDLEALSATNHNGGAIHFGNDGKLYIAVGENAVRANSQTLNNRLGKILRINSDGSIPTDNPFFNTATGNNRSIYAMGLRNPFTFNFDPITGTSFVNDVGEGSWEEVNLLTAGANYGWGSNGGANEGPFDPLSFPQYTAPTVAYARGNGTNQGRTIAGGAFYRSSAFPTSFAGDYFHGDYLNGWIRGYDSATNSTYLFASNVGNVVDMAVGPDGALYYANIGNGTIGRIGYTGVAVPEAGTAALAIAPLGVMALSLARRRRPAA